MIGRETFDGTIQTTTDKISYIVYKSNSNEYELNVIDEKKFIVIKDNSQKKAVITDFMHTQQIQEWHVLNSLIAVYEQINVNKKIMSLLEMIENSTFPNNQIFNKIEKELDSNSIEVLIKWCKKYGLPFVGENGFLANSLQKKEYKNFGFKNDFKTCIDNNICGFRIGIFLYGIHIIYKTAQCGQKLEKKKYEENLDTKLNINILEDYIRKTTSCAQLQLSIGDASKEIMYDLKLQAETLLSAAMYTLLLWICSPRNYIIKTCQLCKRHFITTDSKIKYCNVPCNKDMYRKQYIRGKNDNT